LTTAINPTPSELRLQESDIGALVKVYQNSPFYFGKSRLLLRDNQNLIGSSFPNWAFEGISGLILFVNAGINLLNWSLSNEKALKREENSWKCKKPSATAAASVNF
jgi:hypothetical protein